MNSTPRYDMFTRAGDARVHTIFKRAIKQPKPWQYAYAALSKLSENPKYGEATDTAVREVLYSRICQATESEESFYA